MSNYITTYTGKHFEPANPNPECILIEDIAHALLLSGRLNDASSSTLFGADSQMVA